MPISPALSAMMCDGMGWFEEADYKRILLTYDRVYYLLPQLTVEFRDVHGSLRNMLFPVRFESAEEFEVQSFRPDDSVRELLIDASRADAADSGFRQDVAQIPPEERLYTWRVVNADGDISGGRSLGLKPEEEVLAHAILLNKFLLAADSAACIPISGKHYIHALLSRKFQRALANVADRVPEALPVALRDKDVRHDAVLQQVVSALVSDEELNHRTYGDILTFKAANRQLFERFSLLTRSLVDAVRTLPSERTFARDVEDLVNTRVWSEKAEVDEALRAAWRTAFSSGAKHVVKGDMFETAVRPGLAGVALGVVPGLTLASLPMAALLGPAVAVASWALLQAVEYFQKRNEAQQHGLYYIMRFTR